MFDNWNFTCLIFELPLPLKNLYDVQKSSLDWLNWIELNLNYLFYMLSFLTCFLFVISWLVKNCTIENESNISLGRATSFSCSFLSLRKITFIFAQNNILGANTRGDYGLEMWVRVMKEHCIWVYKRIVWTIKM